MRHIRLIDIDAYTAHTPVRRIRRIRRGGYRGSARAQGSYAQLICAGLTPQTKRARFRPELNGWTNLRARKAWHPIGWRLILIWVAFALSSSVSAARRHSALIFVK